MMFYSLLQGFDTLTVNFWLLPFGLFVIYHGVRAIYLIYFSPLSIFPGSKWAALGE